MGQNKNLRRKFIFYCCAVSSGGRKLASYFEIERENKNLCSIPEAKNTVILGIKDGFREGLAVMNGLPR